MSTSKAPERGHRRPRNAAYLLALLTSALLVACGGGEAEDTPTSTPVAGTSTAAPATPTVAATADGDPALTQSCENAQVGFAVRYPDGWATADGDAAEACRYFAPGPLGMPPDGGGRAPIEFARGADGYTELVETMVDSQTLQVLSEEPTEVAGHEATRFEVETSKMSGSDDSPAAPSSLREYRYVIATGGGALMAVAYGLPDADYEQNRRVLDAMVQTLELRSPGDWNVSLTQVVDKERGLPAGYEPVDVVPIPAEYHAPGFPDQAVRAVALEPLIRMLAAARDAGFDIRVRSSYRSYQVQVWTFQYWIDQLGEAEARRVSAPPGHSEHQLGTTADLTTQEVGWELSERLGDTEAGAWLTENAPRFGFALSYAEGTESTTGYKYEPWHWRYIGPDHAIAWAASGLTLVEYLERLPTQGAAG
ncbi:MAG: hypothetical protein GEU80_06375 [Dehalococcoidia bacterium]|nr:hypothetical protein [Dehalococcoidia bacterium]